MTLSPPVPTASFMRSWRKRRRLTLDSAGREFGVDPVTWLNMEKRGPAHPLLWAMALAWYDQANPLKGE